MLEKIWGLLKFRSPPAGIKAETVFQGNYPPEAWEITFRETSSDNEKLESTLRTINKILDKTPESRSELLGILCEPYKIKPFSLDPDEVAIRDYDSRQFVIDLLATSEENLRSMKTALEKIIGVV